MPTENEQTRQQSEDAFFLNQAQMQGRGFDDLSGFEKIIASLFMFFAKFLDPDNGDSGLNNLFAGVLGMDNDGFRDWHRNMKENDWNWRETQDFTNFDFRKGNDLVTNPPQRLLDMISKHESGGNYNVVYGGRQSVNYNGQSRQITDMTVNEVIDWQKKQIASGAKSTAAGRYQIINKTLEGLKSELGLTGNEKFDEAMQDRMGMALLQRRGLDKFLAGGMTEQQFMLRLSQEWAALPKDMGGRSYYAGDGLNKAHEDPRTVIATLRQVRAEHQQVQVASADNDRTTSFAKTTDENNPPSIRTAFAQAHDNVTAPGASPGAQPQPEAPRLA